MKSVETSDFLGSNFPVADHSTKNDTVVLYFSCLSR